MSATPPTPKLTCPECETEIVLVDNKLPAKCAKCQFPIAEYSPFERLMNAYVKQLEKANKLLKEKQPTEEDPLPSFLKGLRG